MNAQQVFDKIVKGLDSQNWQKSIGDFDRCYYRSGQLKCAAGWLIPDELYSTEMESQQFCRLLDRKLITLEDLGVTEDQEVVSNLVTACQMAHDCSNSKYDMIDRFYQIASTFQLAFN